jgi:hypothetical protein
MPHRLSAMTSNIVKDYLDYFSTPEALEKRKSGHELSVVVHHEASTVLSATTY